MAEMIFELLLRPVVQMLLFLILTILSIFIVGPKNADSTWNVAGIAFVGFMIANSILICFVSNSWRYFFYSLGFSVLYLICIAIIVPTIIKLLKIEGSGESAMIFIFIMYHPATLLFVLLLKWAYFKFV